MRTSRVLGLRHSQRKVDGDTAYRSPSQYSHAEGVGGAARGAQVTRPAARRRRPAPPSYPPAVRPSVRARAELDEEIFSLSASTRCPLSMGKRRFPRVGTLIVAALLIAAVVLWLF